MAIPYRYRRPWEEHRVQPGSASDLLEISSPWLLWASFLAFFPLLNRAYSLLALKASQGPDTLLVLKTSACPMAQNCGSSPQDRGLSFPEPGKVGWKVDQWREGREGQRGASRLINRSCAQAAKHSPKLLAGKRPGSLWSSSPPCSLPIARPKLAHKPLNVTSQSNPCQDGLRGPKPVSQAGSRRIQVAADGLSLSTVQTEAHEAEP